MLLDRGLEKYGYISLGSMEEDTGFHRVAKKTLPDRYADRFPFLIDGFINDYDGQYGKDFKITHAFFNFVNESSADKNADNGFWTRACMTEKTTKAFAAGQIPIILGPYGNLHCIRSIGFDLFDDIIDNSYDSITNQYLRTIKAVEQLEKVCDKPIQYWQEWKQQNMERFEKNNFILKNLMKNHRHETQLLIQDYLKDIKI